MSWGLWDCTSINLSRWGEVCQEWMNIRLLLSSQGEICYSDLQAFRTKRLAARRLLVIDFPASSSTSLPEHVAIGIEASKSKELSPSQITTIL